MVLQRNIFVGKFETAAPHAFDWRGHRPRLPPGNVQSPWKKRRSVIFPLCDDHHSVIAGTIIKPNFHRVEAYKGLYSGNETSIKTPVNLRLPSYSRKLPREIPKKYCWSTAVKSLTPLECLARYTVVRRFWLQNQRKRFSCRPNKLLPQRWLRSST